MKLFKERLKIIWKKIRVFLIFLLMITIPVAIGVGFFRWLETIIGNQMVQNIVLGLFLTLPTIILILVLVGLVYELYKIVSTFITWLFIEPFRKGEK